jgi:uncharacterized protein (TIGR02996 family)
MSDAPFLSAIAANPRDRTVRLIHADWLEERGDERHELIRVCEEMRRVPVFADRYWELKARRNELRAACPADWLAATGLDGSDYDPIFRDGVPDDWKGRWRVVREFTERWHRLPMGDVGGRTEEVRATEERLGLKLPPSLREYVAYAHDVFPQPDSRMVHRDWYLMEPMPGHPAISLMIQGEGDKHWAVQTADLGTPDPLVHTYIWDHDYDGPDETHPFVLYEGATPAPVSAFVLGYVEGYKDTGGQFAAIVRNVDRLRQQLEAAFPIRRPTRPDCGSYESPAGILASFYPDRSGWRGQCVILNVCVRMGVSWEAVPEFLWEYARRKHMCSGMFFSQADVESGLTDWGNQTPPDWVPRQAVPPMREPPEPELPLPSGSDDVPF